MCKLPFKLIVYIYHTKRLQLLAKFLEKHISDKNRLEQTVVSSADEP